MDYTVSGKHTDVQDLLILANYNSKKPIIGMISEMLLASLRENRTSDVLSIKSILTAT